MLKKNSKMDTYELIERDLRTPSIQGEPPRIAKYGGDSDVDTNDHVAEEQPFTNERLAAVAWRHPHDRVVWRVETKRSGWQTVGDEVDPKELDGN